VTQSVASTTFYRPPFTRARTALAITALAALAITSLVLFVYSPCLQLVVASSNEKYELLSNLASPANYSPERVERRCVQVRITSVASGTAERELLNDWQGLPPADRPHVWSPAATTWLLLLSADRAKRGVPDILPAVAQPLIYSPLVLAMPAQMAAALRQSSPRLGWHDIVERVRDPAGWARFGKPWGPFRLGQTTPLISTSGLHAMLSLSVVAQSESDPDAFLRAFDSSVVHYADSVKTFLTTLYAADSRDPNDALSYVSAIAVEEKQVFDYNRGNPTSLPCTTKSCGPEPREKLVAIYPKEGTYYADHPYAILNWPNQPDAALYQEAALNFERYLERAESQAKFQLEGFRNHRKQAGDALTPPYFDPAEPKSLYSPPLPAVIRDTIDHWTTTVRKPANGTLLVDVDTALGRLKGDGTPSVFASVTQSIGPVLKELGMDDVFTLRTFPTSSGAAYREVLDPMKLGPPPSQLALRVEGLQTERGTRALYSAIRAAAEDVRARFAPGSVNAVVVITAGGNQTPDSRDALSAWFQQQTDRRVLLFVVALSSDAFRDLAPLVQTAGGVNYDASDPRNIEDSIRKALLNL
jgi:Ca-activated chloride channel family protein